MAGIIFYGFWIAMGLFVSYVFFAAGGKIGALGGLFWLFITLNALLSLFEKKK